MAIEANFGVRTAMKAGKNGLSHSTTGTVDLPRFRGQFSVINSPHHQFYSAAGETNLGNILVGGSASYSPNNGSVNTGLMLGNSPKTIRTPQVQITYNTHSDKTNKSQTVTLRGNFNFNRDGNLMFTGTYSTAQGMQESSQLSLNAATGLDIDLIGRIMATGGYSKMQLGPLMQQSFDFGLAKQLGPGMLNTGFDVVNGRVFPRIMYTISK